VVRPLPQGLKHGAAAALGTLAAAALLAGALTCAQPAVARPPARWLRVSVGTLWARPGEARSIDAPACAYPADPRRWPAGLTTDQRRWLVGRLETQALYGAKVYVLDISGSWSKVVVPGQPTSRSALGYPGWLPTRQLTSLGPVTTGRTAVLRRPSAWLYSSPLEGRVLELSYGTRLPVLREDDLAVQVACPDGRSGWLRRSAVFLHDDGAPWPAVTGARLVAEARRFLGLQYLWAGTAGFGLDCSGLTYLVARALGVTIPRDAGDQLSAGRRVGRRSALLPGDLAFFRGASGTIHHVGMYVGGGKMLHAPSTGHAVSIVSLDEEPYAGEFAGGRRLTP
jgi:gamma-D-glutamyl-L-lysine dipeptidyl-peptidase